MTLVVKSGFNGMSDPDASAYVAAVEAADGQLLEFAVGSAINSFVLGCKNDGIWDAIKASCILMGARTLAGALIPLKGTAPTNVGNLFVSGDYDRKTGLGDANNTTKYLDSNRLANLDPQNSHHLSVYKTSPTENNAVYIGQILGLRHDYIDRASSTSIRLTSRTGTAITSSVPAGGFTGFLGVTRSGLTTMIGRFNGTNTLSTVASVDRNSANYFVFNRNGGTLISTARLAFYSIGEFLPDRGATTGLELLDTRITALYNAIGAAI